MARNFVAASSHRVTVTPPVSTEVFTAQTFAAVVYYTRNSDFQNLIIANTSGSGNMGFDLADNVIEMFSGGTVRDGSTGITESTWVLLIAGKPSGTSAGLFSYFKWTDGSWTDETVGTMPDNGALSTLTYVTAYSGGQTPNGDIAALMYLPRHMPTGERRRLPGGNWAHLIDHPAAWMAEFPSGRDQTARCFVGGRLKAVNSAVTGTARASHRDPPGFAFSRTNRRK